ncbi:MAG: hypothetical protein P0Y53_16405 [Candidatus Pseudobacter hemicellulosilyticus]|uniref:DUF928 domain-containing protein n=1 Tax=Candidatus Pseudobacter hemicellulosilyticus TaxID=3121375 RepID=A0AAJ6BDZ3_9BACT|nr:MAG: hypothetical protein P0Y53_16405 [Pseudobacter sp.]
MKQLFFLLLAICCRPLVPAAQVNFVFLPEIYGRSVDGLATVQVQSLHPSGIAGSVHMLVKESTSGLPVVKVITPVSFFPAGISTLPRNLFNKSSFNFFSNALSAIAGQTRNLPAGEYSFCFTFFPDSKSGEDYENCFDGTVQPLVPLTLITPSHLDTICDKRPVLSWQPPIPFSAGMRFRLMLTEKVKGTAIESLLTNRPLLFLDNISGVSLLYPATHPELQEGKTYCWQVIAYEKGVVVSKSEIWDFTVRCKEEVPPVPTDSYRELRLLQNGNYYISDYYLKFSFMNHYNVEKLAYEVLDLAKGMDKVKRLPDIKIRQGLNLVDIDLSDSELTPGREYLMIVRPFNEPAVRIRFVYMEENKNQ